MFVACCQVAGRWCKIDQPCHQRINVPDVTSGLLMTLRVWASCHGAVFDSAVTPWFDCGFYSRNQLKRVDLPRDRGRPRTQPRCISVPRGTWDRTTVENREVTLSSTVIPRSPWELALC
jgi:hypothetical protein